MSGFGRVLIIIGLIVVVIGVIISVAPKVPWLGKLPGDFYIKKDNFSFYFPLATCLLLSALFSFILWLFRR